LSVEDRRPATASCGVWTTSGFTPALAAFRETSYRRGDPWREDCTPLGSVTNRLTAPEMSARTWDWPAGPTLRPRYLAPISYPPISYPCPPCRARLGLQRFPCLGMALAIYSILITTVATLTNAFPQFPGHPNPLFDLHIPMLLEGQLAPNLGTVYGLPPWHSVAVYYAILCGGIWWLWRRLPPESAAGVRPSPG